MTTTLMIQTQIEDDVRIALGVPLAAELRRISLGQFDRILDGLAGRPDPETGVHEARKAMKRLRALLRLVRDEIGYFAYRQENVVLRDVARRLAPVRDTDVMVRTLDELRAVFPDVNPAAFDHSRVVLEGDHRAAVGAILGDRQLTADLVTTVGCCRRRFAARPVVAEPGAFGTPPIRDGFAAVAGGVRRVYRRGRTALHRSEERPVEENFHDWRKRVKYLRYQLESLQPIRPDAIDALVGELDELGELLGSEHDHAVLETLVLHRPVLTNHSGRRRLLLALLDRRRRELQEAALGLGSRLFVDDPDAFVGRLGDFWDAARGPGT